MIHVAGTGANYHPTERRSDGSPIIVSVRSKLHDTLCGIVLAEKDADRGRTVLPLDHPAACPTGMALLPATGYEFKVPVRLAREPKKLVGLAPVSVLA